MNFILNLLNNWLFQAIIGNIIWIALCYTVKKIYNIYQKSKKKNNNKIIKYNKSFKVKLENLLFWFFISSMIGLFTLTMSAMNGLHYKHPFIFSLLDVLIILTQCILSNKINSALDYCFDNKYDGKKQKP